jgi:prevent-host-death family protein
MTMKKVNIFEAKAKLSEYLDLAQKGEQVFICRRNHPVAELRPVAARRTSPRPLGGTPIDISSAFYEPLPLELEEAFYAPLDPRHSTAAERRPGRDGTRKSPRRTRR